MTEVEDLIKESVLEAIREASLDATGEMRGAPAASGQYPPSTTMETGGQMMNGSDPGAGAPSGQAEMRGAPQANGVSGSFFTGEGAPKDFPSFAGGGSEHVSDDHTKPSIPGPSEHVSESCAICTHSKTSHGMLPVAGQCLYCTPRGSLHRFAEALTADDLKPQVTQLGPEHLVEVLNTAEAHRRMFTETEQAQIRIFEANDDKSAVYRAHSMAAMSQSMKAMSNATAAHHQVAAAHHELAAAAAEKAADGAPKDSQDKKDMKALASFHTAQSDAHKKAANAAKGSGLQPSYSYNY